MSKPLQRQNQEGGPGPLLDPEIFNKFLENQARELALREQELLLQHQQSANAHEYAQLALQAQVEDREQNRKHHQKFRRERLWFATFVSLLLAAFLAYTLTIGKDVFAQEILKALVYLLAGGLGGYSLKTQSAARSQDTKSDSEDSRGK